MTKEKTKLIFATPGSIISKLTHSDPYLKEYNAIIIDEAHERSLQTDLILLLLIIQAFEFILEKELTIQQLCIGDGTKESGTIVEILL